MSYKERRTDLKDGLGKRPGFCWHPQGCNGDITVHMRVDVLQHAGPKRYATSPEDRREAWAELRWPGMDAVSLLGVGAMDCCDGTGLCSGGSLGVERVQRLGVDLEDQERYQEKGSREHTHRVQLLNVY